MNFLLSFGDFLARDGTINKINKADPNAGNILHLRISCQSSKLDNKYPTISGPTTSPMFAPNPCIETAKPLLSGNKRDNSPNAGG